MSSGVLPGTGTGTDSPLFMRAHGENPRILDERIVVLR
jgi:hypothetical protein